MPRLTSQLMLSARRSSWQAHDDLIEDKVYAKNMAAAIRRDRYQCQYCGFQSVPNSSAEIGQPEATGFMTVSHIDEDHQNHDVANFATACPYCEQTLHSGNAYSKEHGIIIYLPEITQAQLNLLMHAIGTSIHRNDQYNDVALRIYFFLRSAMGRAMAVFGNGVEDPVNLGNSLMRMSPEEYRKREGAIAPLRFLPDLDAYETEREYWATHSWNSLPSDIWEKFA